MIGIPSVPASQTQIMRAAFEVNFNQSNTEIDFMQGSFKVLTDPNVFPALTQDDINAGGTLHQMAFIKPRADSVGIIAGSFADERTLYYSVASLKTECRWESVIKPHAHSPVRASDIRY